MSSLSRKLPLPQGEGWGEGIESKQLPDFLPLILPFSRREKGHCVYTTVDDSHVRSMYVLHGKLNGWAEFNSGNSKRGSNNEG